MMETLEKTPMLTTQTPRRPSGVGRFTLHPETVTAACEQTRADAAA
jgi:hypothetical protein